jgi:hypothetical protein
MVARSSEPAPSIESFFPLSGFRLVMPVAPLRLSERRFVSPLSGSRLMMPVAWERSSELDDDAVETIMKDAVNRTYVLLSKLSNAMGDMIVERLKEQDDVPGWDDPDDARLFG